MDVRRAAVDLVFRTSSSYGPSLSPSAHSFVKTRTFILQSTRKPIGFPQTSGVRRGISTSQTISQQGAAAARKEEDDDGSAQNQLPQTQATTRRSSRSQRRQSELDFLSDVSRTDSQAPSPARPRASDGPRKQPYEASYRPRDSIPGVSEQLSFLKQPRQQQDPQQQQQATPPQRTNTTSLDALLDGLGKSIHRQTPASNNRSDSSIMMQPSKYSNPRDVLNLTKRVEADLSAPSFRLGPSLGRTVEVDARRNMDLARAFSLVNVRANANRVKSDFAKQKFHERPGMKKKRLFSERWRKRFQENMVATIVRVEELRRKGW